jgi:hypothetical protein
MKYILLSAILFLCGCAKLALLPYMDQALMLEGFGKEKTAQQKIVENIDANYDKLSAAVASGAISKYKTEKHILADFGEPILIKTESVEGKELRRALYRKAIGRSAKDKIYLYYDNQGNLIKWESQPASLLS